MGINSLGIGSGVLTADVIDQLRAADESTLLNPVDGRIVANKTKSASLVSIETLLNALKTSVTDLNDATAYTSRTVDISGSGITVTADDGVPEQSFTLTTTTLAKKEILESSVAAFGSGSDLVSQDTSSGTYDITINGTTHQIAYDNLTTLDQLVSKINTEAGADVTASTVQVANGDFRLILTSTKTGIDQAITTADSGGLGTGLTGTGLTAMTNVQAADDATFVYNGITVTRASNEVTDLINGVKINLLEEGQSNQVTIAQDKEALTAKMQNFVDSYNNVITQVNTLINAGEGETAGVFSGDNFIKSISRELTGIVTARAQDNSSIVDFGISFDKTGTMLFKSTDFLAKLESDPEGTELLLSGDAVTDGIFDTIEEKVRSYVSYGGLIDNYESGLDSKLDSLEKQRERVTKMLDSRYEIMAKQFAAYDAAISRINANFGALQQQILAANNANNN